MLKKLTVPFFRGMTLNFGILTLFTCIYFVIAGLKEIDENHPCYSFKYLRMKECSRLRDDDYLKLAQAEQDGLLTIQFCTKNVNKMVVAGATTTVPKRTADADDWDDDMPSSSHRSAAPAAASHLQPMSITDKLKSYYQKDEFSYNVQQWNSLRAEAIEELCNKHLYPEFENECRGKLMREAKSFVFGACAARLRDIMKRAPYAHEQSEYTNTMDLEESGLRVVSIAYANNEDGSEGLKSSAVACAAFLNGNGEMEEYIGVRNINIKLFRDKVSDLTKMSN